MTDKEFIKKYKDYIIERANIKQAFKLLIFWRLFYPGKWKNCKELIEKGKAFDAAFDIVNS